MKKFIIKIYAFSFFDELILIYPLYVVMFTDFSMKPWQVATLLAVWSATAFLLEIPSGVLADKYSRKKILFIGQLIRFIGYASWLLFPNFFGFLAGFVLWGAKGALTSGTFQALIYDELKLYNKEHQFTKILGRTKTLSFTAILIASILASPAILLGYSFVLILSNVAVLIAGIMITMVPKAQKVESIHQKNYFSLLKEGLAGAFKNAVVFHIIIFLSLALLLEGSLDEYWSIYANEVGLPKYGLGLFHGLMSGMQGFACFIAYRFEKRTNRFFYTIFFVNGVLLFLAAYLFSVPTLLLLVIFSFLFTIIHVVYEGKLQHSIPSNTRATISSVSNSFVEMGVLFVYFSFGTIAQLSNYRNSFLIYGAIIAAIGLIYMIFGKKIN